MKCFKIMAVFLLHIGMILGAHAQSSFGKIVYERKTNLHKKFKEDNGADWIRAEDKNKTDYFELFFNDTLSMFRPQESELKEKYSWATSKNTVYLNFVSKKKMEIKDIWGEKLPVSDSLPQRTWKITGNTRTISGYKCRKAIWQKNDSTRIYAWYTNDLMCSSGPESMGGLPGIIMGLATEDGGVVYFAKSVELTKPDPLTLEFKKEKKRIYTTAELRKKIEVDFGKYPWGKALIKETFDSW